MNVAGIVLCGGKSTRMGAPKALFDDVIALIDEMTKGADQALAPRR